ncbi:hypothetical protein DM02DRAFT_612226 [Periconia macrospinosa]|uniref:Uncharacterized protein n=1 Tax=Periconia macrospinosa TaxID=97972 RepID=A0A2V1DZG1_9PLEO|nr:hypothetical protein DM02DRAFT_612226 [Periconia macrospinosa]
MTTGTSIPMVVCGRNPNVAQDVRRMMVPEFDVVHACLTPEQAIVDITRFAQKLEPLRHNENVGSQNYSKIPNIITMGGGYDPEACVKIKEAVDNQTGGKGLLWLWPDATKKAQAGPVPTTPKEFESYASGVVTRIKERTSQADFTESEGGVFYY